MSSPQSAFEVLVVAALDDLPDAFLKAMDNLEIVVEPEPRDEHRRRMAPAGSTLLGLYEGVPKTYRTSGYGLVVPDKITIFEGPIRRLATSDDEALKRLVRRTVIHEIAHHFGISDDRLRELGAY